MTNEEKTTSADPGSSVATLPNADIFPTYQGAINTRIVELEVENIRLQRLVAELLLKNQQLRRPTV
jgi:hypothetical protein